MHNQNVGRFGSRWLALAICLAVGGGSAVALPAKDSPVEEVKPELVLQLAHSNDVAHAALAGHDRLLTEGSDGTLKCWDSQTSELLKTVPAHQGIIAALRAAPDGELVASGGETGGVKLWNARDCRWVRSLLQDSAAVSALAFSADGSTLAAIRTGEQTDEVVIWDARTWREQRRFQIAGATGALALSADGALVAVGGAHPGQTGVWETRDDKFRFAFDEQSIGATSNGINALAFVPPRAGDKFPMLATASYLANDTQRSQIHLWNALTGEHLRVLLQTATIVTDFAFSPDGKTLALRQQINGNSDLQLWDVAGEILNLAVTKHTLSVPNANLGALAFSPDGQRLASGGGRAFRPTTWIFDVQSGQLIREITAMQNYNPISKVALSRGQLTAIGEISQNWDATAGVATDIPKVSEQKILSPDGQLYAEIYNTEVRIEDAKSDKVLQTLGGGAGQQPEFALFSPDSRILVTRESEFQGDIYHALLKLWEVRTGKLLQKLDIAGYNSRRSDSVAFSPDGAVLAIGGGALLQLWDVKAGRMRAELQPLVKWRSEGPVVFSRDGRHLAAAVRVAPDDVSASAIKVWDWPSGRLLWQLPDAGERAVSLAFSADASLLVSGEKWGDLALWDMATGKLQRKWEAHLSAVSSVAFADDATDSRLASGGADGAAKLWDVKNGELLATFRVLRREQSQDAPERVLYDWIVYTPTGYYRASPQASPFIRWRQDDELLPATTDESAFARPALVQQALTIP